MGREKFLDEGAHPANPRPDRPLLINGGEFAPDEEETVELPHTDALGNETTISYWNRCPGDVSDLDPEWSTEKVEEWIEYADSNLNEQAWKNMDDGIRPLMLDLNRAGSRTGESNIWCSGSYEMGGPPFVSMGGEDDIPDGAIENIQSRLPDGYSVTNEDPGGNPSGLIRVVPNKCIDEGGEYPNGQCMSQIPGEEVQQVDEAFVRGLRESI